MYYMKTLEREMHYGKTLALRQGNLLWSHSLSDRTTTIIIRKRKSGVGIV